VTTGCKDIAYCLVGYFILSHPVVEDRDFVYHVSNDCYKSYTLQKSLDKLKGAQDESELQELHASCKTTSSSSSRAPPSQPEISREQKCIICNCAKYKGTYNKYQLSEDRSANKFLKAAVALQDAVYVSTCDLQDVNSVFGADLFYHDSCMKGYVGMYERKVSQEASAGSLQSLKLTAWNAVLADIAPQLESGSGFELSKICDAFNTELNKHEIKPVTNREVKVLLVNQLGDDVRFSESGNVRKSAMCFDQNACTAESLADVVCSTDVVSDCAILLRNCLLGHDFDLQDRFCDADELKNSWKKIRCQIPCQNSCLSC